MSTPVTLPALGESVTEGTVTRWLKQVGDAVAVDEPLLEVSTDKVDTEIPSPVAGTLLEIKVNEDETVEVGAELAVVGAAGSAPAAAPAQPAAPEPAQEEQAAPAEALQTPPEELRPEETTAQTSQPQQAEQPAVAERPVPVTPDPTPAASAPAPPSAPAQQSSAPAPASSDNGGYVTPLVRKMAAEHGVDLSGVAGTGVGGRIRKQDVLDAARQRRGGEAPRPAGAPAGATAAQPAVAPQPGVAPQAPPVAQPAASSLHVTAEPPHVPWYR